MIKNEKRLITPEEIFLLTVTLLSILDDAGINYIITGSLAFYLLTGNLKFGIKDLDIIVSEKDFGKINKAIIDSGIELNPIQTEHSIHANHKNLFGTDNKPFDVSLDSLEYYYLNKGIPVDGPVVKLINNQEVKVTSLKNMIGLYTYTSSKGKPEKREGYKQKLEILKSLS